MMATPTPATSATPATSLGLALKWAIATLTQTSVSARLDAETLTMHITGFSRAEVAAHNRHELSSAQTTDLYRLVERRASGEPVAYLTGKREFWSLELTVSPSTLIPRPETELLVEQALAVVAADAACTIVDLGTGCGAIALALAKERWRSQIVAIDNTAATLDVAQKNAWHHKLKNIEFLQGSWFEPLARRVNVIVSNPPYIRNDDPHLGLGDVRFEPACALIGGVDGLDAIRHIITHAKTYLYPRGVLLLEHGYDQRVAVHALMQQHGYDNIVCHQDLAGHDRVSICQAR